MHTESDASITNEFFFEKKKTIPEIFYTDFVLDKEYTFLIFDITHPLKPREDTKTYFKYFAESMFDYREPYVAKRNKVFIYLGIGSFKRAWQNREIESLNPKKKYDVLLKFKRHERSFFILDIKVDEQKEDKYPGYNYGVQ